MNDKLIYCFGDDYKYHVSALYPVINGARDNKFGIVQLNILSEILENLRTKLDERNESSSENIRTLFSRLNRSMEQIENYLNGKQNCSQEDANIYLECIETKMAELYEFAVQIDEETNSK